MVDISIFPSHSTMSASTAKDKASGISLNELLRSLTLGHGVKPVLDRWRFYEMKFMITPGAQSALKGNSVFMNKTDKMI